MAEAKTIVVLFSCGAASAVAAKETFRRDDIVDAFTVTKQTASATVREYQAIHPDALAYCRTRKAFVRPDQLARTGSQSRRDLAVRDVLTWLDERACNSQSYGSHADAYEIAARRLREALSPTPPKAS